jgi:hypothetical protein
MARRLLAATTMAAFLLGAAQVAAHVPPPLLPTALVEGVTGATADVEFMDYVGAGQVIKLKPRDVLILSYLESCEHETITGGTVIVGAERSDVKDGRVVRSKVPCDGGKVDLTSAQANNSAATSFRSVDLQPTTLYGLAPVVQLPKALPGGDRTLLIERTDRPGKRHELMLDDAIAAAGFYDLAKAHVSLVRGATYDASIGGHKVTFLVDAKAKSGSAPIVSRLLRFQ